MERINYKIIILKRNLVNNISIVIVRQSLQVYQEN